MVGIDYTPAAVERTRALLSDQDLMAEVVQADVLTYQPNKPFDAIYEQTCLCALHPDHWVDYARQLQQWLAPQGSIWALFMQMVRAEATEEGLIQDRLITATSTPCGRSFLRRTGCGPGRPMQKCPIPMALMSLAFI